jgi:hypothetical protein
MGGGKHLSSRVRRRHLVGQDAPGLCVAADVEALLAAAAAATSLKLAVVLLGRSFRPSLQASQLP